MVWAPSCCGITCQLQLHLSGKDCFQLTRATPLLTLAIMLNRRAVEVLTVSTFCIVNIETFLVATRTEYEVPEVASKFSHIPLVRDLEQQYYMLKTPGKRANEHGD